MRSEKIDTRRILAGDLGYANGTDPDVRVRELTTVRGYWPDDLLENAARLQVAWRTLVDPTRWTDIPPAAVCEYVREFAGERGYWPSIDTLHRRFGRVSNHRLAGEDVTQETLAI